VTNSASAASTSTRMTVSHGRRTLAATIGVTGDRTISAPMDLWRP